MSWVFVGHFAIDIPFLLSWTIQPFFVSEKPKKQVRFEVIDVCKCFQPARYALEPIYNANVSVDSFQFISGCLVAVIAFKAMDKVKENGLSWAKFWFGFYVQRYIRLTVVYAFVIALQTTYFRFALGNFERFNIEETRRCQENWYINLLYANNIWKVTEQCITPTWYLAMDMQLYVFSPLLLYPLWRGNLTWKSIACGFWLLFSAAVPFSIIYAKDWPLSWRRTDAPFEVDYQWVVAYASWARTGAYVCGIIVGYFLHITKNKAVTLKAPVVMAGWIAAFVTGWIVVYGVDYTDYYNEGDEKTRLEHAFYVGFYRLAWGAALGWLTFACARGYGGIVNAILSWRAFMPLAKLTYAAYLIHISSMRFMMTYVRYEVATDFFFMSCWGLTAFAVTIAAAFVIYLLVELPFGRLQKMLFENLQ